MQQDGKAGCDDLRQWSRETTVPFGAALREYRLAAGLTQEALAERAGVSPRTIQALEREENTPTEGYTGAPGHRAGPGRRGAQAFPGHQS
jgi:DNA-binding XRE family transcriptional regulator